MVKVGYALAKPTPIRLCGCLDPDLSFDYLSEFMNDSPRGMGPVERIDAHGHAVNGESGWTGLMSRSMKTAIIADIGPLLVSICSGPSPGLHSIYAIICRPGPSWLHPGSCTVLSMSEAGVPGRIWPGPHSVLCF